jgi:hypothetical protein
MKVGVAAEGLAAFEHSVEPDSHVAAQRLVDVTSEAEVAPVVS